MYGVLKSTTNTGLDSELQYVFSTPLNVFSNQPAFVSDTMSLKRKTNSQKVQRWEVSAQIMQTNDSPNFLIHSVKNGLDTVFPLRMPQVFTPVKITQTLSLTLTTLRLKGVSLIDISGLGSVNLEGQFISFSSSTKVYLVTGKGNGSGGGIEIAPPLLTNISAGVVIKYGDSVTMYARYDTDTQLGIAYDDGVLSNCGTVKFIEAL